MAFKTILVAVFAFLFGVAGVTANSGESGNCSQPNSEGTCKELNAVCGSGKICLCPNRTLVCSSEATSNAGSDITVFGSDFFVCLTIAGIVALVGVIACCAIKIKAASHRSSGNQAPKPLVGLSSDY